MSLHVRRALYREATVTPRHKVALGILLAFCLYLIPGCSDPSGTGPQPRLTTSRTVATYPAPSPVVTTAPGTVSISGVLYGGVCERLTAASNMAGSTLTVTISARSTLEPSQSCISLLAPYAYTLTLPGLKPGTIRVVVQYATTYARTSVLLDQMVTVP